MLSYDKHPIALQVELTNHCPYTCLGCPRTEHMDRPLGMMSFDTFRKVVDAVSARQRAHVPMALHHMGESLLHPQIAELARYATSKGVPTAVACRPNHLTPERGEALLRAGVCIFVVSVDGLDTPTLRRLTGKVADYEKAERNIEAFLAIKQRLASPALVQIQMIAYEENAHQWDAYLQRFRREDPTITTSLKRYSSWTVPELSRYGAQAVSFLGGRCTRPFRSFTVLWDGRVVPCNADHNGEVVLGNVNDGIEDLWNGPLYEQFRAAFDDDALPADHMCRKCSLYPWKEEGAARPEGTAEAWFRGEKSSEGYSEAWWLRHWGHLVAREEVVAV